MSVDDAWADAHNEPHHFHDARCDLWLYSDPDRQCTCRDSAGHAPWLVADDGSTAARLDLLVPLPCQLDENEAS